METNVESIISIWEILRDLLITTHEENNRDKNKIFSIINDTVQKKKNWFIPPTKEVTIPQDSCTPQEQQHTAFCTWVLGHLFCIYEKDSLSSIHSSCTEAQIKVFIACSENRYMCRFLFQEYLDCLNDLIEIQTSECLTRDGPQLLKRFTPLPVDSLQELNLMPKYILVNSQMLLKKLEKYIVEIIESVVPYVAHTHEDLVRDLCFILCKLLWLVNTSVKIKIMKTFSHIFSIVNCSDRHALQNMCCALQYMVQMIPHHHGENKLHSHLLQDLRLAVGDLLNTIITHRGYVKDEIRDRDLLIVLRSLLVSWEIEEMCCPSFRVACSNVVSILHSLPCSFVDMNNFVFLLRTIKTQEPAIVIFEHAMLCELLEYVKSVLGSVEDRSSRKFSKSPTPEFSKKVPISALTCIPTWALLNKQLWEEMATGQSLLSSNDLQQADNILGKVNIIVQCTVALDALVSSYSETKKYTISMEYFGGKVGELLSQFKSYLQKLTSIKDVQQSQKSMIRSIFMSVANLMLLPESKNCSVSDTAFAVSLLSLPWIERGTSDYLDLEINQDIISLIILFEGTTLEGLKHTSLEVLANVPFGLFPIWRSSLLHRAFDQGRDRNTSVNMALSVQAVHAVPPLLIGSHQQPTELLARILLPALHSQDENIVTALSEVFSDVVCALAGNCVPVRQKLSSVAPAKRVVCRTCHKSFSSSKQTESRAALSSLKTELSDFMELLTSPIVSVRRNMAASLGSLVLHLPTMYKPDIVSKWMKYAEDPDHKVRATFSHMVKFLIFQRGWMEGKEVEAEHLKEEHIPLTQLDRTELSHSRPRLDRVLLALFNCLNASLCKVDQDFALQKTLLETIVDIGCVPLDCVILPVIKIVLMCVSHPSFTQPSVAQVYLKQIADAHNTSLSKLYHRFQSDICQVLVSLAGMNFHTRPSWTKFMDQVLNGLGFKSTCFWLSHSLHCIAPILFVLVVKHNDQIFLNKIIELLHMDGKSLVKDYFQFIFPYVFLNEDDTTVQMCVKLMGEISGLATQDLLISAFRNVHSELLLHYHCKKDRVEQGIRQLIDVLEKEEGKKPGKLQNPSKARNIAEHLDVRFIGVLIHFDSIFESRNSEERLKIKALQSLPEIIRLLGPKYITPVRFKVLSTLRTALRLTHCDFPHLSCSAWVAFIQSMNISALGPLLGVIVASLLPMLDQHPKEVAGIFKWLVVDHEHDLSQNISDLFFLPNNPVIEDVYERVQFYLKKKESIYDESQNLSDYLQRPLLYISHDNEDIRKHGLDHFLKLLKSKQDQFTKAMLREEVAHPEVAKLLNILVQGCQDPNQDIRLLSVESLGMLGALDPGHLPHRRPEIDMSHILNLEEDQFGVKALTVLCKAYQAARNTRYLDSFAVAIQELLKHYKISCAVNSRRSVWNTFPESIQQVMAPLENTSYYMTSWQANRIWPHPVFGTRYAVTLTNWAHTWACRIVSFIDDPSTKRVFIVCIPSLKTDINCVMFFLPFILLYAVISGSEEQHKMMEEEMTFIIKQCKQGEEEEGEKKENQESDVVENFQIRTDKFVTLRKTVNSDSATDALCAKTVFSLLDFLEKWVGRLRKEIEGERNSKIVSHGKLKHIQTARPSKETGVKIINMQKVQSFLALFSKLDLSVGNYGVKEYARALMYLEDYLMEKKDLIKDHLGFLGRIYAEMNEADGIKGVLAIQCIQPKLIESVVYHEVTGQYQEALACYELLAKLHSSDTLRVQMGMVRCCLSLDQPCTALRIAEGVISNRPEFRSAFLEAQAECFWRTYNFEDLDKLLSDPKHEDSTAWGVSVGRCLIDISHQNEENLSEHLRMTRSSLSKALSTASLERGSYMQGYQHVLKLHMLQDLQEASSVVALLRSPETNEESRIGSVQSLVKTWLDRFELVQAVPGVQEQLLRLHRSLLHLALSFVQPGQESLSQLIRKEIGHSWLKSAEVARTADCYQQAYVYLLNAGEHKPKRHFIEFAKLHWQRGVHDQALSTLKRGLEELFPSGKFHSQADDDDRKICAEAKLLVAVYNDQNTNVDMEVTLENYKGAVEVYQSWEKSHANLAQYYDRMTLNTDRSIRTADLQTYAVHSYTRSLRFGCNMIYHTMSRMLTIWLDYGKRYQNDVTLSTSSVLSSEKYKCDENLEKRGENLHQMNKCIEELIDVLPPYMFMTGFSQLVSRICHPMKDVSEVIKRIIVRLLSKYPQQTMWMLVSILRSSYPLRSTRCKAVLSDPLIKRSSRLVRLTNDFERLANLLIELCQKPIPEKELKTLKSSVIRISEALPRLLTDPSFSDIIVPLQSSRTLTLPKFDHSSFPSHVPFPEKTPFIARIQDEVIILRSLQKPRKITFLGSDGQRYEIMCKDKDDLRLDARVMEFNSIVNNYLQKDQSSLSRNLNIRTYSVVPLNDSCGLIEWVPNLAVYRLVINQLIRDNGLTTAIELKEFMLDKNSTFGEKRKMFLDKLVPLHPPVFRHWFRNNFTDSRSWFEARKSYVHTTAVMSMVGYILGLGDRHGENILLDTTCGDIVHVDFNCLFNKGETFEWDEKVPFRLTHNMVSAMGPTGVEGPFRQACEITLHMLREMRETLLSVLQPFVYDPLVAWSRKGARKPDQDEKTNEYAVKNVRDIDLRLNGRVKVGEKTCTLQLSVEGQTAFLIQEATSIDNLCQMYIGWGAYM